MYSGTRLAQGHTIPIFRDTYYPCKGYWYGFSPYLLENFYCIYINFALQSTIDKDQESNSVETNPNGIATRRPINYSLALTTRRSTSTPTLGTFKNYVDRSNSPN